MRKNPFFFPDAGNPGGKATLETLKKNHVEAILNTKAITNSFKSPHPHIKALSKSKQNGRQKPEKKIDFMRHTAQALRLNGYDGPKAVTDTATPISHYMRKDISRLNFSEKNYILKDHVRNVKCLVSRLAEIDSKASKRLSELKVKIKAEKKMKNMKILQEKNRLQQQASPMGFVLSPEAYAKFKPDKKSGKFCYDFFEINNSDEEEEQRTENAEGDGHGYYERGDIHKFL